MTFSTTTISDRPNGSPLTGAERVPMDQGTQTIDASTAQIAALATKQTVGLGSCDDTSDANKPVSTATQAALDGKANTGAISSSGLTMTAGILGRESGTGAPQIYSIGSGLAIVGGALTATGGGGGGGSSGTVTSVALSVPLGFAVTGSPITTTGTLALAFAAGYGLPTTASQSSWDVAAALAATAVQPAGLTSYVQTSDARLSDSREWSAATVSQAEAEAGVSTSRRAFTAQRVFQAAAAWWAATASATGQALATAANAGAARTTLGLGTSSTHDVAAAGDATSAQVVKGNDTRLSDARTPTAHNQAASTITGLATVATSGAYSDLSGRPTIPAAADATPAALGTAAIGSSTDYAREDHVHALPSAADVGAVSATTTRTANTILAGPTSGSAAAPTFRAMVAQDLPPSVFSLHSTLTAASNTYTLDATAANEFTAGAAVAGNTTITAANLSNIPSGYVWRCVLRFAYTSGAITFAAPAGFTAKAPASTPTLTAGRTYDVIARVLGGGTVIDYRYGGDGYTT